MVPIGGGDTAHPNRLPVVTHKTPNPVKFEVMWGLFFWYKIEVVGWPAGRVAGWPGGRVAGRVAGLDR